jgi:hypothetical protein
MGFLNAITDKTIVATRIQGDATCSGDVTQLMGKMALLFN